MIIGLGTDILDIDRFEKALNRHGQNIINRLFTPEERAYCEANPRFRVARYAKRFCAKEAALKALGTGRSQGIRWHDVSVANDPTGKPVLLLTGKALSCIPSHHAHISLSDSDQFATATVILERTP